MRFRKVSVRAVAVSSPRAIRRPASAMPSVGRSGMAGSIRRRERRAAARRPRPSGWGCASSGRTGRDSACASARCLPESGLVRSARRARGTLQALAVPLAATYAPPKPRLMQSTCRAALAWRLHDGPRTREQRMFKHLRIAAASLGLVAISALPALSQGTLRIGMTAADIPQTTGQPDQGFEGFRFAGYTIYDALVSWDLSKADAIADIKPGLATEWSAVEGDGKRWIFKLREGVKFHDGTDFDSAVVLWNFDKILNDKSPQYDPKQAAQSRGRVPTLVGWKAIDKYTVELTTRVVNSLFPYDMSYIFYSSPTQWEKLGKDWVKYAQQPVGTGPFKVDRVVPRERLELSRFDGYWDKSRVPKLDKVLLFPMPEAATRTAALLAGPVDWIEVPAPDAIPRLQQGGMTIVTNKDSHNSAYQPSTR